MPSKKSVQAGVGAWIQSVRPASSWFVIVALVVYFLLSYLVNIVANPAKLLPSIPAATGHVVSPTLLNYVPLFIVMGLLLAALGRLRCHDLGLIRQRLLPAIAWVLCTWIAAHVVVWLVHRGDVSWDPAWHGQVIKRISRLTTGQMLGNALYEEVFWRAFLISQIVLILTRRLDWKMGTAITAAMLISAILFALSHIAHDLAYDRTLQQILLGQVGRFAGGVVFAAIFFLSNNLFIVIGIHSLVNAPCGLFEDRPDSMPLDR